MTGTGGPYRHLIPELHLPIERNTGQVPNDGKYYLVRQGHIIESFKSIKRAEERFRELVKESGHKPKVSYVKPRSAAEEGMERYLDAKDQYWAESYRFRGKGGKGGRGGI